MTSGSTETIQVGALSVRFWRGPAEERESLSARLRNAQVAEDVAPYPVALSRRLARNARPAAGVEQSVLTAPGSR